MSTARHHAEWLSLLEISGPFLSMPVLLSALPQGLDAPDPDHARELRAAYEEWADNQAGLRPEPAIHTAWIRYVLQTTLEFPDEVLAEGQAIPPGLQASVPEHGVTLRPDLVVQSSEFSVQSSALNIEPATKNSEPRTKNSEPGTKRPRLLIQTYPAAQDLEKTIAHSPWQASPGTAMMTLLRATGVRLGLVTNGEQWLLVDAPAGETTGFVTWYAALWLEEPLTLRAFRTLLGVERFFNVPDDQTLEALLAASAKDQQEVTDQLGYQVRRAVEILIQSIDRADQDRGRALLAGLGEPVLYEAALTVMMRLVFLLTAEERNLLPLDDLFYAENYAVATLRVQQSELADKYGEALLEYRYDAWSRLLATFRVVHSGLYHDRLTLPAYGGSLFDPDRFPFLEGRSSKFRVQSSELNTGSKTMNGEPGTLNQEPATPLPISNRTVLHLLNALQLLQVKVPGGGPAEARRLSFRALDIEQIGHVYESLLDHTAVRADEAVLGLTGTRDKEPEIPLPVLESFLESPRSEARPRAEQRPHAEQEPPEGMLAPQPVLESPRSEARPRAEQESPEGGLAPQPVEHVKEKELLDFLQEQTGRSTSALKKALPSAARTQPPDPSRLAKLRAACGNDDTLFERVLLWANLVRDDDFGQPVVIPAGSVYVTAGVERRATGTHYTPKALTEPIVQHTLEPLVYKGPAEGQPREQWQLRPAADLLSMKVCDMAMGSGAFLVQTCRYLSERLVEAWDQVQSSEFRVRGSGKTKKNLEPGTRNPELRITPEGQPATGDPGEQLIPADPDERLILARRLVADRCLYGVDKNPLAVEMAKLSLWLITLDKNRPFTFLDHALKNGDSLVGVSLAQLLHWNLEAAGDQPLYADTIRTDIAQMVKLRRQLAALPVNTIDDQAHKAHLLAKAEAMAHDLKRGGDMLLGSYFNDLPAGEQQDLRDTLLLAFNQGQDVPPDRARHADLGSLHPFHWPLEFPEVFLDDGRKGFDAFMGNPPFIGGRRIRETLGDDYRELLYELYPNSSGNADYSAFFFLQGFQHLQQGGTLGLIATNTIAQGDTQKTGLDTIVNNNGVVYNATNSRFWPGAGAAVVVSVVHIAKNLKKLFRILDGKSVDHISAFLDTRKVVGEPYQLVQNEEYSHMGTNVVGMGFVLSPEEAKALIEEDPENSKVLYPFINGQDLNSNPNQSGSRWIINFFDWSLEEAEQYSDCMAIVRKNVYPDRKKKKGGYAKFWWQYGRRQDRLYKAIAPLKQTLAIAQTSQTAAVVFIPTNMIYSHKVIIFAFDEYCHFALLQSAFHEWWARRYSSTLKQDLSYTPSSAFQTFPFPNPDPATPNSELETIGETYHERRRQIMLTRQEGLTKTYNRFHNPAETAADIAHLRELHVQMDTAVAAAYGWADLDLAHDFHDTPQGLRFTLSESARREVLGRLLALNHQRYEEEVLAGLHEKGKKKAKGKAKRRRSKGAGEQGGGRSSAVSGRQAPLPGMEDDSSQQLGLFDE